jgi:hypothetical protein
LVNRPDRVQVWASQLAANDFPPVCAMTGRPAETWRRFTFSTPPPWAYALLVLVLCGLLGLILAGVIITAVSIKASGHLPLTRASSRLAGLILWVPAGLILGGFGLWTAVVAAAVANVDAGDPNAGAVGGLLFLFGLLIVLAGLIARLVVLPLTVPRGRVTEPPMPYNDKLVELRNVHPAFVAAVQQVHQARAAGYAGSSQTPYLPGPG